MVVVVLSCSGSCSGSCLFAWFLFLWWWWFHRSDMQVLALMVRKGEIRVMDPACGSVNADQVFGNKQQQQQRTCHACQGSKPPFALHFSHASLDNFKGSMDCLKNDRHFEHWNFKRAACLAEAR